jgi:hypothetical protein
VSTLAPGTFEFCLKIVPLPVVREMRPLMDVVPGRVGREHWFVRALVVSRWAAEIVVHCGGSRVRRVLFVGDGWAEEFHDVELQDEAGGRLGKAKLAEGIAGVARLHAMIGEHVDEDAGPVEVVVGIETDRGPWVRALVASGYLVYPINPLQVARFRETERSSGGKSDAADAHTLADMVRTKRHTLKPMAGNSGRAETVKVLTREASRSESSTGRGAPHCPGVITRLPRSVKPDRTRSCLV